MQFSWKGFLFGENAAEEPSDVEFRSWSRQSDDGEVVIIGEKIRTCQSVTRKSRFVTD